MVTIKETTKPKKKIVREVASTKKKSKGKK